MKNFTFLIVAIFIVSINFAQTKQISKPISQLGNSRAIVLENKAVTGTLSHCGEMIYENSIGNNGYGIWSAASKFSATELTEYVGQYITKISVGIAESNVVTSARVAILTGSSTSPVIAVEQNFIAIDGINDVTLINPFQIPAETDIMIAYEVTAVGGYPLGADDGPVVEGANLISIDGLAGSYMPLTNMASNLTFNFVIAATVENEISTSPVLAVLPETLSFAGYAGEPATNAQSVLIYAANLIGNITTTTALPFEVSTDNVTFGTTAEMSTAENLYVRYNPAETETLNIAGTVTISSEGAESKTINLTANTYDCTTPSSTFPFVEGFENSIPACWTIIDNDGDGHNWEYATDDGNELAHNGSLGCISSSSYYVDEYDNGYVLNPDNWIITPPIALGENSPASLSFFASAELEDYAAEHYGVYISTTTTEISEFTLLFEETMDANGGARAPYVHGEWGEKNINLDNYAGETVYIAFRHFNSRDNFHLLIDDITILSTSETTEITENIASTIAIYPNPANNIVTISNAENQSVVVLNTLGQIVSTIENATENQTIDVTNFATGTYFVKVNAEVVKLNLVK